MRPRAMRRTWLQRGRLRECASARAGWVAAAARVFSSWATRSACGMACVCVCARACRGVRVCVCVCVTPRCGRRSVCDAVVYVYDAGCADECDAALRRLARVLQSAQAGRSASEAGRRLLVLVPVRAGGAAEEGEQRTSDALADMPAEAFGAWNREWPPAKASWHPSAARRRGRGRGAAPSRRPRRRRAGGGQGLAPVFCGGARARAAVGCVGARARVSRATG